MVKNIVLVGFMGTGKSVVGRRLAKRLGRPFLDLDRGIEQRTGWTVAQIFAEEGEAGFRRLEKEAVRQAAALEGHVVATGGGVLMDEDNVRLLKSSGTVVCLTASPEVILKRVQATLPRRPMLAGGDPRQRVEALLALRAASYAKADVVVETSERSVDQVVEEVLKSMGERR